MLRLAGLSRRKLRLAAACAAVLLWPLAGVAAEEGKRYALIIGNDAYTSRALHNAVNDARAINRALQDAGFETILKENAGREALEDGAVDFLKRIGPDDTALFFYAGHAVQITGQNLLIPVDFVAADSVIQAKLKLFSLVAILDGLKERLPKRSIIIIDACRTNPVADKYGLQAGLAEPMNAGKETYIAFSASFNQVAQDNPDGTNSWFTEALAEFIAKPGLMLDEIFTQVGNWVQKQTKGKQIPWKSNNLTSNFYFHPKSGVTDEEADLRQKWMLDAERHEKWGDWPEAIEVLNRIASQTPADDLAKRAAARIPYLNARKEAADRFDKGDFASAAGAFSRALQQDPFAMDAALGAVSTYLLSDRLTDAVGVLKSMRVRGTSTTVDLANAILKELAPVQSEARQEHEAPIPAPVPIQEIFRDTQFGAPDWDAGKRYSQGTAVDLSKALQNLLLQAPPPPARSAAGDEALAGNVTIESFHVEVQSIGEDRVIGVATAQDTEFGFVKLTGGQRPALVVLNGQQVARQLPYSLQVLAGKYIIRTLQGFKEMSSGEIVVKAKETVEVVFEKELP